MARPRKQDKELHHRNWEGFGDLHKEFHEKLHLRASVFASWVPCDPAVISKIDSGKYFSLILGNVLEREIILFISTGVIADAEKLVSWLNLIFDHVPQSYIERIANKASESKPDPRVPVLVEGLHSEIVEHFIETIEPTFNKLRIQQQSSTELERAEPQLTEGGTATDTSLQGPQDEIDGPPSSDNAVTDIDSLRVESEPEVSQNEIAVGPTSAEAEGSSLEESHDLPDTPSAEISSKWEESGSTNIEHETSVLVEQSQMAAMDLAGWQSRVDQSGADKLQADNLPETPSLNLSEAVSPDQGSEIDPNPAQEGGGDIVQVPGAPSAIPNAFIEAEIEVGSQLVPGDSRADAERFGPPDSTTSIAASEAGEAAASTEVVETEPNTLEPPPSTSVLSSDAPLDANLYETVQPALTPSESPNASQMEGSVVLADSSMDTLGPVAPGAEQADGADPLDTLPEAQIESQTLAPAVTTAVEWRYEPLPVDYGHDDFLAPDEVCLRILQAENSGGHNRLADIWNVIGGTHSPEVLADREQLDYYIAHWAGKQNRIRLGEEYLNWMVDETVHRLLLAPGFAFQSGMSNIIAAIGRLALDGIQNSPTLESEPIKISYVANASDYDLIRQIVESGPTRIHLRSDGQAYFQHREQADYWAARYLLENSPNTLWEIARNQARPFGVLWQAVRRLHFTARDQEALQIIRLVAGDEHPLASARFLDAAHLLVACEGRRHPPYQEIYETIASELCRLWVTISFDEWRESIAYVMRDLNCELFRTIVERAFHGSQPLKPNWRAALRSASIVGDSFGIGLVIAVIHRFVLVKATQPDNPKMDRVDELAQTFRKQSELFASNDPNRNLAEQIKSIIISTSSLMQPADEAQFLTEWYRHDNDSRRNVLQALKDSGTMPALRALEKISARLLMRESGSPAYAALVANDLIVYLNRGEVPDEVVIRAQEALAIELDPTRNQWAGYCIGDHSRSLATALARVWARLDIQTATRAIAARGLIWARATTAFNICLSTLPLLTCPTPKVYQQELLPNLLFALTTQNARDTLLECVQLVTESNQLAVLLKCLGKVGGLPLEQLDLALAQPDEQLAVTAIEVMSQSSNPSLHERLNRILDQDTRPSVRVAARRALARRSVIALEGITSDKLVEGHIELSVFDVAALQHPTAEILLIETAQKTKKDSLGRLLCLQALAESGGPAAIGALRRTLGVRNEDFPLIRGQIPANSGRLAREVWVELLTDASKDWRDLAIDVLVKDGSEEALLALLDAALADKGQLDLADELMFRTKQLPNCPSERLAMRCLSTIQNTDTDQRLDLFAAALLAKAVEGLTADGQRLPLYLRDEMSNVLPPRALGSGDQSVRREIILILGHPDFPQTVPALEKVVNSRQTHAAIEVREAAVQALAGIGTPEALEALSTLKFGSHESAISDLAGRELALKADYKFLVKLSRDKSSILSLASVVRDVRFQQHEKQYAVIYPNGRIESIAASSELQKS